MSPKRKKTLTASEILQRNSRIFYWTGWNMIVLGLLYVFQIPHLLWAKYFPSLKPQEAVIQFKTMSIGPGFGLIIFGIIVCGLATGKIAEIIKAIKGNK